MNRARCKLCGDIIESKDRHDYVTCKCGNLSVDGGQDYHRRSVKHGLDSYEELPPYECYPGWWKMLDDELKYFREVDPALKGVRVKEKFGMARIEFDECDPNRMDLLEAHASQIERASSETCELCGDRGELRNGKCRCDRCRTATREEQNAIMRETAQKWSESRRLRLP